MREGEEQAREVLRTLQELVDARDLDGLLELFDEDSVLIASATDGRDRAGVRRYLEGVAGRAGELRWDWEDVVPFHRTPDTVGFAAFGDVVVTVDGAEWRQPIRMTGVAVRVEQRWRLRHFHGSIPFAG